MANNPDFPLVLEGPLRDLVAEFSEGDMWTPSYNGTPARLLTAALHLFAGDGYSATTTRQICDRAGLSPAAMYAHFSSKEEVLRVIVSRAHELITEAVIRAAEVAPDRSSLLRNVAFTHIVFHAKMTTCARVANYSLPFVTRSHRLPIMTMRSQVEKIFHDAIADGCSDHVFEVRDARIATISVLSLGLDVSRWFSASGPVSPERLGLEYSHLIYRMLGAPQSVVESLWP